MKLICRIDRKIYACISENIVEDEVIITDERINHSNRHDNAFFKYGCYLREALLCPDYIFEDKRPNTGIVIKRIMGTDGKAVQIVLRVKVETDPEEYKNSIISCWDISESRLQNYLRNRRILYKGE